MKYIANFISVGNQEFGRNNLSNLCLQFDMKAADFLIEIYYLMPSGYLHCLSIYISTDRDETTVSRPLSDQDSNKTSSTDGR